MLRALLVDDQPRATARLTALLAEIGGIEVIGTARTLAEAREFLSGREPDVVFLEVSLPGRHGLELLADVGLQAHVIVVTESEVAAVAAFEYGALDYILKPVALPRLQLAVERLRRACGESKDGSRRGLLAARPPAPARLARTRVTADAKLPLIHAGHAVDGTGLAGGHHLDLRGEKRLAGPHNCRHGARPPEDQRMGVAAAGVGFARHLPDCPGETHGPGGEGVSARVPGVWRRHPADRLQTAFRVRNHPWPSHSWQPPVAADFLSANPRPPDSERLRADTRKTQLQRGEAGG